MSFPIVFEFDTIEPRDQHFDSDSDDDYCFDHPIDDDFELYDPRSKDSVDEFSFGPKGTYRCEPLPQWEYVFYQPQPVRHINPIGRSVECYYAA